MTTLQTAGTAIGHLAEVERVVAQQAVEIERLRVNDARYQWLRKRQIMYQVTEALPFPENHILNKPVSMTTTHHKYGQELDAAIEAAIQKELT